MSGSLFVRSLADLRRAWQPALRFHLVMQLAGIAIVTPLLTLAVRALFVARGSPVISNYDIAGLLVSPLGAVLALAALVFGATLLFTELAGQAYIAQHAIAGRCATLRDTVSHLLRRLPSLAGLSARVGLRLALLALPFVLALGVAAFAWLREHDINYYLAEQPAEWVRMLRLGAVLGIGYALLVVWQLVSWVFALPALTVEAGMSARESLAESERLARDRIVLTAEVLVGWWVAVGVAVAALLWIGRHLTARGLDWAGIDLARLLPLLALYVGIAAVFQFVASGIALAGHQFLVTRIYYNRVGEVALHKGPVPGDSNRASGRLATRALAAVVAIAILASAAAWFAISRTDLRPRVEVTAHRGASAVAPENTLAAFRAAIDAGAGWIELDVQRLRDGRLVVLHDSDFMRMAGDPRRVTEIAAGDLAGIDIGRRFGGQFAAERAPLLEEAIALARGRVKLNVELKYNVPDPALAPAVVDLLRRERFVDQSVITSLDYTALQQVEWIEPEIVTGHILTAAVGDVVATDADFLSLNAAQATPWLIWRAHRAGKRVHVWTVNTPEAMLVLAQRGVDNIITDDPALLERVRAQALGLGPHALLGLRLRSLFGRPPSELGDPDAVAPP
jgi:glycerophosphoryl diester phosphodiesterase